MKVCHFVASTGLGRGDACVHLVNSLVAEIEVALVVPRNARLLKTVDKRVEVFEYGSNNARMNPLLLIELYKLFKSIKPDIVHTHFAKATEIYHFINKLLRFRHVATKHNTRKGKIFNNIFNVIAVSNSVAESINNNNVEVIYNGLPKEKTIKTLPRNDTYTVLAVGRLEKIKAFDKLIIECSKLNFDFSLFIVGEGKERANLEKLAKEMKLEDKVRFLGFRDEVPALMRQADVVVVCSRSEGFSLVILEAMSYSNMVVSRKVGIAAEIFPEILRIEDFDIASKLQEVHDDPGKFAPSFNELKRRYGPMFSMEHVAKKHIDYYKRLLE